MSQYLDRKQVIELYEKFQPSLANHVYEFGEKLRSLPVTQDSHGEWKLTLDGCECSVCKDTTLILPMNFCPNCGSDNRPREGEAE